MLDLAPAVLATMLEFCKRIEEAIKKPPEEFAEHIYEDMCNGDQDAAIIFNLIVMQTDFDTMMVNLEKFKAYPQIAPYIIKIQSSKAWGTKALAKFKELKELADSEDDRK